MTVRTLCLAFFAGLSCLLPSCFVRAKLPLARSKPEPEATSLLGKPLFAPKLERAERNKRTAALKEAEKVFRANPGDEEAIIWKGRRLAYLGRYREAIATYRDGLLMLPRSFRLLRHRGHRHITVRNFQAAASDLSRAAEYARGFPDQPEADGMPNAQGVPRSTQQSNIYYHLGLAHYLRGEFGKAADAYATGLEFSRVNDDMLCATTYWSYLTQRRLGNEARAAALLEPIQADMEILENSPYHRLLRMFQGHEDAAKIEEELAGESLDDATLGYGLGAWFLVEGEPHRARAIFRRVHAGKVWAAFGYIAAEAELNRPDLPAPEAPADR